MAEKMKTNELVEPVAEELPVNTPEPEGQPLPVDGEVPEVETPSAPAPEDSGTGKNDNLKKLEKYVLQFNPDADVSTPDAVIAALVPLVESIVSFHDDLNEVVEEFPEFGDFIIGLRKGFSPQEAAARYLDIEGIMPPEGADDFDAVQKAKAERREQVDKRKAWETKLPENQEVTSKNFAAVVKELGLDEATQQSIVDNLEAILKDAKDGIISADHWKMLANGLRHETVVAEKDKEMEMAVEDAKIAGRNEQIKKKRINKDTGDGLPKLTNSGVAPTKPKKSQLIPSKKEFRV
jgi:hypothetical protein